MANTHFKGPVISEAGFVGDIEGSAEEITGSLSGDVTSTGMVTAIDDEVVTGKALTGLAAGSASAISATDSILEALAKLQAQIDAL